jgi:hypothetical protein
MDHPQADSSTKTYIFNSCFQPVVSLPD